MFKLAVLSFIVAVALARNTYFDGKTRQQIHGMMGTRLDGKHQSRDHGFVTEADFPSGKPPASFDSATKWPHCANTINYIKDQAACGSCWAVAASEVAGDRTCIECDGFCPTNGPGLNENQPCFDLSAAQLMSCCDWCGDGCQGGYPIDAMRWWAQKGLVTGGWYNSKCGCYPYTVDPTSHTEYPTPACKSQCINNYPLTFIQDTHMAKDFYQIDSSVTALKMEIMNYGPIECAFSVYLNFLDYPNLPSDQVVGDKKIYWSNGGTGLDGGHAIKITGWDVDSQGREYWIIHNSWNVTWGLNGVFHYKMHGDLYGMESQCVAGRPRCSNSKSRSLTCVN